MKTAEFPSITRPLHVPSRFHVNVQRRGHDSISHCFA